MLFSTLTLKVFLDHRPREEVSRLVSAKTNGATPLILSSRNGHLDVVEYLVDKCCASVDQPGCGSVTFDGETSKGAPPLWGVVAAGHLDIVKLWVKSRAQKLILRHCGLHSMFRWSLQDGQIFSRTQCRHRSG